MRFACHLIGQLTVQNYMHREKIRSIKSTKILLIKEKRRRNVCTCRCRNKCDRCGITENFCLSITIVALLKRQQETTHVKDCH